MKMANINSSILVHFVRELFEWNIALQSLKQGAYVSACITMKFENFEGNVQEAVEQQILIEMRHDKDFAIQAVKQNGCV